MSGFARYLGGFECICGNTWADPLPPPRDGEWESSINATARVESCVKCRRTEQPGVNTTAYRALGFGVMPDGSDIDF